MLRSVCITCKHMQCITIYATSQYGKDYTRPAMQIIAPYPDSLVTHLGVNKALKIGKT